MGQVLVDYNSINTVKKYTDDEALQKKISKEVFGTYEWAYLDIGLIDEAVALERTLKRLDSDIERDIARKCFENWHKYNMVPKEGMAELLTTLKEKGFHLFVLSNAPLRLRSIYKEAIPFYELFDDIIFSAEVRHVKPQKEIYEDAFERFGIKPQESFFVDDLPENIQGGKDMGMDGYCFSDGDVEKLKVVLLSLQSE